MKIRVKVAAISISAMTVLGGGFIAAPSASAATGSCAGWDACLFFNSNFKGAKFGDGGGTSKGASNYGAPNWYKFGGGNGAGYYVKNNAASVFDYDSDYSVTIYYNSNMKGPSQYIPRGTGANLDSTLKNNNASQCFDFYNLCP